MSPRKISFLFFLIVSTLCLIVGFFTAGQWIGAVLSGAFVFFWLLARKRGTDWLPHLCLIGSLCLAVVGKLTGAPALWMICGATTALAAWDMLLLVITLPDDPLDGQTRRYEIRRIKILALATGIGLILVFLGQWIRIEMGFMVTVILAGVLVYAVTRLWGYLSKRSK